LLYGVYTVHATGPIYVARIRVSPAEASDSGMGNLSGATGLLAGLGGGSGTVAVPKFVQFLAAIGSVEVAEDLDHKYDLLCQIYKGQCDPSTHQWKERSGMREWFAAQLNKLQGLPDPNGARTYIDLADYFSNSITVETNKTNSMVTLTYTNRKPELAARYLSLVVKNANDFIRTQNHETQKQYVEYLSQSAAKTANVEQRQAIDTLLLQEERQLMMTEVDIPYAAKILDGPVVLPVSIATKTLAIYTFAGVLVGLLLATIWSFLRREWWDRR
jgi:hypothetical protein